MSLTFWGSLHSFIYRCLRDTVYHTHSMAQCGQDMLQVLSSYHVDSTHTKENSLWNLEVKSNFCFPSSYL